MRRSHQAVRKLERELHASQASRGEASEDLRAAYEKQLKAYERFVVNMQRHAVRARLCAGLWRRGTRTAI